MNDLTLTLSSTTNPEKTNDQRSYRLTSIDMLRGLVLVIMVLDHVRSFVFMTPLHLGGDLNVEPLLFFIRWITHFCAPVFIFLAGTSAGLMTARKPPKLLGEFLFKRGLWLIFVEMVIVSTAWTFSPLGLEQMAGYVVIPMQVIWAIGASMVVLAGFQFLGRRACLYIGAVIVLGHNLLDPIWPQGGMEASLPLWAALHTSMSIVAGPFKLFFGYPLLPWIGVMLLGFGAAPVFEITPEKRKALLLKIGLLLTIAFVVLRVVGVYGEPRAWHYQSDNLTASLMSLLNTTKYPPSLLYLLMTLGPAAILCAYADQCKGWWKDTLVMFGRVPFIFYVAHLYIAHAIAVGIGMAQGFTWDQMSTLFIFNPKQFGLNLAGTYALWLLVLGLLYPICRWAAEIKARRRDWWLSYV